MSISDTTTEMFVLLFQYILTSRKSRLVTNKSSGYTLWGICSFERGQELYVPSRLLLQNYKRYYI